LSLNSELWTYKARALPLEPHFLSICSGCFGDGVLVKYLLGLALNHDPPDLSFSSR
jgi:hypothetical protein